MRECLAKTRKLPPTRSGAEFCASRIFFHTRRKYKPFTQIFFFLQRRRHGGKTHMRAAGFSKKNAFDVYLCKTGSGICKKKILKILYADIPAA